MELRHYASALTETRCPWVQLMFLALRPGLTLILGELLSSPSPCTQGEGWGGGSFFDLSIICVRPDAHRFEPNWRQVRP